MSEKLKLTITYLSKEKYITKTAVLSINKDASIRDSIIGEIRKQNGTSFQANLFGEPLESISLAIKFHEHKDDAGEQYEGFGLNYCLVNDGSIHILHGYEPLHHDWTIGELRELHNLLGLKGNVSHIEATQPMGLGAIGVPEIMQWVGYLETSLAIAGVGVKSLSWLTRLNRHRQYRKIANQWINQGIRYPEELRQFIDRKGEWTTKNVCKLLNIDEQFAYELLSSLGYSLKGNKWLISQGQIEINNRKNWIRNERKYAKKRELA